MEERITDLEIRFMHQERTIHELSDALFRQQQAIERLEGELRQIRDQFGQVFLSPVRSAEEEEPPPHY
jgi:SlyX protein